MVGSYLHMSNVAKKIHVYLGHRATLLGLGIGGSATHAFSTAS
jgi:hypothetical protein